MTETTSIKRSHAFSTLITRTPGKTPKTTSCNSKEHDLEIKCIPNNMEKYMAFMLGKHLVFLGSFQFKASSVEGLAANLPEDAFKYTYIIGYVWLMEENK